jgi:hypothetical protein
MPRHHLLGILVLCASAGALAASDPEPPKLVPIIGEDVHHDLSPPLMLMPPLDESKVAIQPHEPLPFPKAPRNGEVLGPYRPDPDEAQEEQGFSVPNFLAPMAPPLTSFPGVGSQGAVPPDTNGDVGPNHYVQWVNLAYAVWNKSGTLLYGPVFGNTIWQGFGGLCETRNSGDPIALYDPIADRWFLSQLAFINPDQYHQCIAVSQTSDPTGPWYRYDYFLSDVRLNDYPKFGVWPDAYYMSVNEFNGATQAWAGQGVFAFERAKMLVGAKAKFVYFNLLSVNANFGGALPADLDGPRLPPAGAPNPFVEMDDNAFGWTPIDRFSIWNFHVDWVTLLNSTFGQNGQPDQVVDIGAAGFPFDSNLCNWGNCVPIPGGRTVDTLADRLMYRNAYRNYGDHEALALSHSVDVNSLDRAGVRWYEMRKTGGPWSIWRAGTHSTDTLHRWMGSAAMDGMGDLAVAYNVASSALNPEIRYAGRLAGDPSGALSQTESTLVTGGGTQTGASRWGDYSMLAIDPTDDCTFWFTGEYYAVTSGAGWATRIGSFRFPACVSCSQIGTPALSVTKDPGGTLFGWTAALAESKQDLVRGDLSQLRATGNYATSTISCGGNDLSGTSVVVNEAAPALGGGYFYLLRGQSLQCRGSLDDGTQLAGRDAGVTSSGTSCP